MDAPDGQFTAIAGGFDYTCGIRLDGTVACWGTNNWEGQADAPDGEFTAVAAYVNHTCGIRTNQTIACWGQNNYGQTDPASGPSVTDLSVPSGTTVIVNFQMASASSPDEDIETPVEVIAPGDGAPQDNGPQDAALEDVVVRDNLIANQESLLNTYRCMFNVDAQKWCPAGALDGKPAGRT